MSSQRPTTTTTTTANTSALSKSAKKKAKKAAKAAKQESVEAPSARAGAVAVDDDFPSPAQFASVAANAASRFAQFAYAADVAPGSPKDPYYDEAVTKLGIDPAAVANAARTGALQPEHFSFGGYPLDGAAGELPSPLPPLRSEELLETANELFRRMHYDSYGEDDPYWASLPPHVRQFIREAIPFNGQQSSAASNDPNATQKDLYAMAQRIVSAASQGIGFQGAGTNLLSSVNGRAAHLSTSIAEDLGFHNHPNHAHADPGMRDEPEYDDDEDYDDEPEPGHVQPNGEAPKKKNKKKKKKASQAVEPPPATLPPPAVKQPPRQPVPPQPQPPIPQPQLNTPPPPVTAAPPTQPPPSSRAAGKQPMTHAPVPAANPPARSVRAAGKAPVSATQHTHHNHTHPPPPKPASKGKAATPAAPAKIWTTASAEERERITQFWLALDDTDRKNLLQVEKDAVLKRMKEQQRHSCGCAVCGRKKVNIEMELDQLYDNYYDELERYTSHQRAAIANQDCPPPPGAGPFPGSVELDSSGALLKLDHLAPNPSTHPSLDESDEYDDDEEYEEEEEIDDDDLASEEADTDYPPSRKPASKSLAPRPEGGDDFFGFGTNLATIKGIITVADEMLKNDGAKFLEMMEQLAVKRVAREELNARELQEETDDDDEDDDISEAQRMEDGRRMFAIFAARMFENRVLQAYRERVAKEREEQLLRELEMEEEGQRAKQEKKAKEAQRKKDKKKAQKQRQDEERAAREAALAEEQRLAKLKAAEDAKERNRRQEEERQRREAVKRAAQEEASRKEAERRKRQEEERARQEEAARKKREQEEKIRKEREAREREAKEKEKREREEKERLAKEKAEKERAAREAREKAEKERLAKLEEERVERQRREQAEQQRKLVAAQQAAREKAAVEKAAAAERAKAAAAAAAAVRPPPGMGPNRKASLPPPAATRNGPSPPGASPAPGGLVQSPPTPSSVRPLAHGPPKTPQFGGYQQQPVPVMSYSARPGQAPGPPPPGFGPNFGRPSFQAQQAQSPVFPQQASNGQMFAGSSSQSSPSAVPRFGPPPDSFDSFETSRATLGVGYPSKSDAPSRVSSTSDDPFRAGPIGQRAGSQPPSSSMFASGDDDFLAPGMPPAPIGSRSFEPPVAPIGAPPTAAPGAGAPASKASSSQPDQVFGSAALGDDDEIVQPAARRPAPGWGKIPPAMSSAPGAGRWSAAPPSIWGMESTPWTRQSASGATPGFGSSAIGSSAIAGVTAGIGSLGVGNNSTFGAPGGPLSPPNLMSPEYRQQPDLAPGAPPGLGLPAQHNQHNMHGHDPRRGPSYGNPPPFYQGSNIFGPQ